MSTLIIDLDLQKRTLLFLREQGGGPTKLRGAKPSRSRSPRRAETEFTARSESMMELLPAVKRSAWMIKSTLLAHLLADWNMKGFCVPESVERTLTTVPR